MNTKHNGYSQSAGYSLMRQIIKNETGYKVCWACTDYYRCVV